MCPAENQAIHVVLRACVRACVRVCACVRMCREPSERDVQYQYMGGGAAHYV